MLCPPGANNMKSTSALTSFSNLMQCPLRLEQQSLSSRYLAVISAPSTENVLVLKCEVYMIPYVCTARVQAKEVSQAYKQGSDTSALIIFFTRRNC